MRIVASGIYALRSDAFSRRYTPHTVFRGEPDYAGALCEWQGGQPAFERVAQTLTEWAFTSTSASLSFARSWPFGNSSPRVLVSLSFQIKNLFFISKIVIVFVILLYHCFVIVFNRNQSIHFQMV